MTINFKRFVEELDEGATRAPRGSVSLYKAGQRAVQNIKKAEKAKRDVEKKKTTNESELEELTQREKEMIAQRKARRAGGRMKKKGAAPDKKKQAPKPDAEKKPTTGGNTKDASDKHIVMQLRKAQDVDGNYNIKVSPTKQVKLKKGQIDSLLKVYDSLKKPDEKRKYRITLIKKLRGM